MWDPSLNETDRKSLMPILTPVLPFMNSTFNVLPTTQRILTDEFHRASEMHDYEVLCAVHDVYPSVLCLEMTANTDHLLFVWKSVIESKIRILIFHLEKLPGVVCRPFTQSKTCFGIALTFLPVNGETERNIDLNYPVGQFHSTLSATLQSRPDCELLVSQCTLTISLVRQ